MTTTFTKMEGDETPLVEVDEAKRLSRIDPMIYGGFIEHMGRCVYGGIYEPGHAAADPATGFRRDVLSALRELELPVVRYPGGNFCATYHWADGVGPVEGRPARPELAWRGVETNRFGTDEFMAWLDELGREEEDDEEKGAGGEGDRQGQRQRHHRRRVEPFLVLNMGTGTLDEALAWVEYCNGTGNTHWANLRRAHGHPEPYGVRYWGLGNEVWGPWQVMQAEAGEYGRRAAQWAKALRLLDPGVVLVLCGQDGTSSGWDAEVLRACVGCVDMHSIHVYTADAGSHPRNATAPLAAERAIAVTAALIEQARIEAALQPPDRPGPRICFDEWNVWDPDRAPGDRGAEEAYTLSDALAVAVWLNVFVRQSRHLGMANLAQAVNVISPLMAHEAGVLRQPTWWPLLLFSRHMRGWALAAHVRCGAYRGPTTPAWLQGALDHGAPWLDVSASLSDDGWVSLAVVNISPDQDLRTDLKGVGGSAGVTVYKVTGAHVGAVNTRDHEGVSLVESQWDGQGAFTFSRHSFTMLRWKASSGSAPA